MSSTIERKVAAGGAAGVITGLIVWALTTYVPAFDAGLPDVISNLINWLVPVIVSVVAGYLAKHTPRPPAGGQAVTPRSIS